MGSHLGLWAVVVWWWGRWWLVVVGGGGSLGPVVQLCCWCAVLLCRRVRVVIVGLSFGRAVVCGCRVVVGGWVLGVIEGRFGGGARRSWAGGTSVTHCQLTISLANSRYIT